MAGQGRGFLQDSTFIHNGVMMVPFFFVLSGFVITYNYYDHINNCTQLGRFIFLRFFRLYPVHFAFLMVWLAFEIARYVYVQSTGIYPPATIPFHQNNLPALVENLFMVQALGFSDHAASFNGPAWSISVEFYTYIIFSFILLISRKYFVPIIGLIAASSFTVLLVYDGRGYPLEFLVNCLTGFFLGALVYFVKDRFGSRHNILSILGLGAFFIYLGLRTNGLSIYPLSAFLIFTITRAENIATRILMASPLRWLGRISYSLYLSHMAVIWVSGMITAKLSGAPLSAPSSVREAFVSLPVALVSYATTLALILVVAQLSYSWIEAPWRRWSRRKMSSVERGEIVTEPVTV